MFEQDTGIFQMMGTVVGIILLVIFGLLAMFKAFYKKVSQGHALIVNDMSTQPKVKFTGALVIPVVHKMEVMKISLLTLEVDRRGADGLICKDNLRADITVAFYLKVNETREDVLKVAKAIGVDRASDKIAVNELFNAKFSEALKTVGKQMNFLELFENRILFREKIIEVIGDDLNGYILEDVAIDYLEQTPKNKLDPNNILDAEGIRRITEVTATQNICTNQLERDEELAIKKKNVETQEAMLELQRQEEDAKSKQSREIKTIRAREEAETLKVQQEERLKSENARIESDEQIAIREENKQRQVEVAEKNRQRAIVIETEKVKKAQQLEAVNREREVELEEIYKTKALEEEKKIIALTISERIAVDKKVAEEQERIKEVQVISEAERLKQVKILEAQAEAEEDGIKIARAAEAQEQKAVFRAKEINLMAQANLEAAAKEAEATKKRAEGAVAERAAPGIAQADVMERQASAKEKDGIAEARVQEVKADSLEKQGLAEAKVLEEKLLAEAKGKQQLGVAEAETIRQIATANADGLVKKFEAMSNMDPSAREFEEFRMRLEQDFKEAMANIEANKDISAHQAEVLAAALEHSNIDIVGGSSDYMDKLTSGMGLGNAVNGFMEKSPVVQSLLGNLLGSMMTSPKDVNPKADKAE
jgi:uncharacterized membrane protein YqiK